MKGFLRYPGSLAVLLELGILLPGHGSSLAAPEREEVAAKAAIVAFAANARAFPHYKCRYRITKGQARSVDDAIQGRFLNARECDCRLLVDGDKDLFEGFAPPPDPKQGREVPGKKGVFMVPSPGASERYLNDGSREMNYVPTLRAVNLFAIDRRRHGILEITPLGLIGLVRGQDRVGAENLLTQPERYEFSVAGPEEVNGHPVLSIHFKDKEIARVPEGPLAFTRIYSFDASRGYLPIRLMTLWNDKPKTSVYVTHARECSNARWFPERAVIVDIPDKDGDLCNVKELKLLELDADRRPSSDEFAVTVPGGTMVLRGDDDKSTAFFRFKQDEKVHMDDIPALFDMVEKSKTRPLMDTAVPHARPYLWAWYGAIAGFVLVLGGAVLLVRRRMKAHGA